jgi:hypothetical protein
MSIVRAIPTRIEIRLRVELSLGSIGIQEYERKSPATYSMNHINHSHAMTTTRSRKAFARFAYSSSPLRRFLLMIGVLSSVLWSKRRSSSLGVRIASAWVSHSSTSATVFPPKWKRSFRLGESVVQDVPLSELADAASPNSKRSTILTEDREFIRPERDLRSYRLIRLPNNLQCLLVCDNMKTGMGVEAASIHVQAGHFDDTLPGLARTLLTN